VSRDAEVLDAIAAFVRDGGDRALCAIRAAVAGTGREVPSVRRFLDLSTAHLPQQMLYELGSQPGVVADATEFGAWLWVPSDPDDPVTGARPPDEVLVIQRYARSLGCDWVLLDADAPTVHGLPTFDWP
jgi:hypothetical protein